MSNVVPSAIVVPSAEVKEGQEAEHTNPRALSFSVDASSRSSSTPTGIAPTATVALGVDAASSSARFSLLGLLKYSGCGFMAAVAFLDPGNLEADIQAGANTRYELLWWYCLCILCFGFTFQVLSAKLGLVTGTDLAYQVGEAYPKGGRILLWVLLELSILAADIQETVGCSLAVQILSGGRIPLWAGCIIVSVAAFLLLQIDRIGFRHLEGVYGIIIMLEAIALAVACFSVGAPAKDVLKGFIPKLSASTVIIAAGALGALVMPYNTFFTSHVVNGRTRDRSNDEKKHVLVSYMKIETMFVLVMAFVVNAFAVIVFASFYGEEGAEDMGIGSAGEWLTSKYGPGIQTMWAIGLLASGLVATLCLTYAGQVIMTGLLQIRVGTTWRLLVTRGVALLPCVTLAVVFEATNTFDHVAQIINVVQSLCLPFGLIPIIQMSNSSDVMGHKWCNAKWLTVFVYAILAAVISVNIFTLVSLMKDSIPQIAAAQAGFSFIIILYIGLVSYFLVGPSRWPSVMQSTKSFIHRVYTWLRTNRRWADIESMLEVHY